MQQIKNLQRCRCAEELTKWVCERRATVSQSIYGKLKNLDLILFHILAGLILPLQAGTAAAAADPDVAPSAGS